MLSPHGNDHRLCHAATTPRVSRGPEARKGGPVDDAPDKVERLLQPQ